MFSPRDIIIGTTVSVIILLLSAATSPAIDPYQKQYGVASSYGPGLYGNRTACGQTLNPSTRGVAHKTLACGTRLKICRRGVCTHARVIDKGPYVPGRTLDLTAATTRELCKCSPREWGHRRVAYNKTRRQ